MEITKIKTEKKKFEKIELREPKVQDIINAQRSSGANDGASYEAALIAEITTFDGKKMQYEDILDMDMDFFFKLKDAMMDGALSNLVKQLFSSATEADLAQKPS